MYLLPFSVTSWLKGAFKRFLPCMGLTYTLKTPGTALPSDDGWPLVNSNELCACKQLGALSLVEIVEKLCSHWLRL